MAGRAISKQVRDRLEWGDVERPQGAVTALYELVEKHRGRGWTIGETGTYYDLAPAGTTTPRHYNDRTYDESTTVLITLPVLAICRGEDEWGEPEIWAAQLPGIGWRTPEEIAHLYALGRLDDLTTDPRAGEEEEAR